MIALLAMALADTGDSGDTGSPEDTGSGEDTGEYVDTGVKAEKVYAQPESGCGEGGAALLLPIVMLGVRRPQRR